MALLHTVNQALRSNEHRSTEEYTRLYNYLHSVPARWAGKCPVCGRWFTAQRSDKKTCSWACYLKLWRKREIEYIVCPVCGDEFLVRHRGRVYCANACKMVAYRRRKASRTE